MSINGREALEANFRRQLPANKDARILDIGCGGGDFLAYLEELGYTTLRGVEVSEERVRASRLRSTAQIDHADALDAYLGALTSSQDLITLKSVIAHFPRHCLFDYLRAIHTVLAPDGRFIVETYNASRWTGSYLLYNDLTHHSAFTEYSLREALEGTGFRVCQLSGEVLPLGGPRSWLWYLVRKLWIGCLKLIYFAERGFDRNPRILTKYLIAVCERKAPSA